MYIYLQTVYSNRASHGCSSRVAKLPPWTLLGKCIPHSLLPGTGNSPEFFWLTELVGAPGLAVTSASITPGSFGVLSSYVKIVK